MEKTGAERVKYSLACQHEDAIPIKFVSYAQKCPTVLCTFAVALRKESVDRNSISPPRRPMCARVALRKESVDRNIGRLLKCYFAILSLSARRAWIEIPCAEILRPLACVALRKESVDRNGVDTVSHQHLSSSLSARRAWIEIMKCQVKKYSGLKSLSARRAWIEMSEL